MSKLRYEATDSTGRVWKRTTTHRVYSHAVVIFLREYQDRFRPELTWPAEQRAEWAGRPDLAENVARRYRNGRHVEHVEVLEARRVT